MKKKIFITVALLALTTITSQLFAQDAASKTNSGWDQKKNVKCRVITTETGCSIAFEYEVKSPRDASTGQASGKKGYDYYKAQSDFSVSASDNSVTEVKSPRDAASGMATGKRQHKPFTVTKEYDKSSPMLAKTTSSSNAPTSEIAIDEQGVHKKVSVQDFHFTVRCGGKSTKISCDGEDCEIPIDCPNGECSLTADWSWGVSQGGSSNRCSVDFLLEIEDGACTAMAINEKGLPGDKGNKGTTKK